MVFLVSSGGGLPSDILTLGFYQLGITGVAITLFLFGVIISKVDNLIVQFKDNYVLKPIIYRVVIYIGMIVMYADLEGTFRSRYDAILLLVLLFDFRKYKMPDDEDVKKLGFKRYKITW